MEAKHFFPNWHAQSNLGGDIWQEPLNLHDNDEFYKILEMVADDQSRASADRDSFLRLSEAIATDTIQLQLADEPVSCITNLHYLQYEVSISPIMAAMNAGELSLAHDWILNGFSDGIVSDVQREFYTPRIYDFLESDIPWIVRNQCMSMPEWFQAFFYYCRLRSALYEVAASLLHAAGQVIDCWPQSSRQSIELQRSMLDWASSFDHKIAPYLAENLERLFDDPAVSLAQKAQIAASFSTNSGRFTGRSFREWAEWALENAHEELEQHETYQLLIATVETEADWEDKKGRIIEEIDKSIAALLLHMRQPSAAALLRDQRSQLLNSIVFLLIKFGLRDDLLKVFSAWYQVSEERQLAGGAFFVLPNVAGGMRYLGAIGLQFPDEQWQNAINDINIQTNETLGVILTVEGEQIPLQPPERPGCPIYENGRAFHSALSAFYQMDKLTEDLLSGSQFLISFPGYPHPLQALMMAEAGRLLPISSSLQEPKEDREIQHAAIWYADNDFYSQMEADAVAEILSGSGVEVCLASGSNKSKADFLDFYADARFDLFWVVGHGIHDHWNPMASALHAGDPGEVTIDEILGSDFTSDKRRLLVLNVCDGGVAAVTGGIQKLGLAPMLATAQQASISHLWPVDPKVASAFGLFLAVALTNRENTFIEAFSDALNSLRAPWGEVVQELAEVSQNDIIERLRNTDIDSENILHWGSPCFFQ